MSWEMHGNKLIGFANKQYTVFPREFWYVVPARTHYSPYDGQKVRPLDFALVLTNASLGEGLLSSPTTMGHGMGLKSMKGGAAAEAEDLLELTRLEHYPAQPSRLRCYFLNLDKEVAEHRMRDTLRGNKTLVRCFMVLNGAKVHFADTRIYERLEGRPDDIALAVRYWETFEPKTESDGKSIEMVADCALYFPDWKTFPQSSDESLIQWQQDNQPPLKQ